MAKHEGPIGDFTATDCSSSVNERVIDEIVNALAGQNHTEVELADKFGMSIEDVEQVMIDAGYERCESCDYWFEASETLGDDDEPLFQCKQCRD